jgi:3'(2'), 5'-bisphosphate nucleotidase
MESLRNKAVEAAVEAGNAILEIYHSGDFDVTVKGDDSPLTRADLASHEVIMRHLTGTGIPVLSEEGRDMPYAERLDWSELWIVDPIDGTKEFIKRNGEFTVNIALAREGVPVLGVIYVPVTGELYVGVEGEGARKALWPADETREVQGVMETAETLPMDKGDRSFTAVASRSHMSPETEEFIAELRKEHGEVALISKGSSLKLCMVAEGKADCYPRFAPTMEWDTAAGQAICMAAGFDVIDQNTGETMRYNREHLLNAWFLVK